MTDYKKMYGVLCRAADAVIEPMEKIPEAKLYVEKLKHALLEAEEIYILTSSDEEESNSQS